MLSTVIFTTAIVVLMKTEKKRKRSKAEQVLYKHCPDDIKDSKFLSKLNIKMVLKIKHYCNWNLNYFFSHKSGIISWYHSLMAEHLPSILEVPGSGNMRKGVLRILLDWIPLPASVSPCHRKSLLLVKHIPLVQSESEEPQGWRTDRYQETRTVPVSSGWNQHTQLQPVFGHRPWTF